MGFIKQKVNYIHNNPVVEKIVTFPENYYFSSARNYAGLENYLGWTYLSSLWARIANPLSLR